MKRTLWDSAKSRRTNVSGRAEFVGGLPYGAAKHVQGMLNGGMTAKEAAAVARAYKRGGVGAGLFATGYYAADQGVSVDSKGNLKIGSLFIPERVTHAPWFEVFKLGLITKNNKWDLGETTYDASKTFFTNSPASEISKALFKALKGDYSEIGRAGAGNIVPQGHLKLTSDYSTNRALNRLQPKPSHQKDRPRF